MICSMKAADPTRSSTKRAPQKTTARKSAASVAVRPGTVAVAKPPGDALPRRRGRPSKQEPSTEGTGPAISKEAIHLRAAQMARSEPLSDISIAALAKHFGVTTTLIHYYIGSRDALVSGIVNRYFQERVSRLQPLSEDWRQDLQGHARITYDCMCEHGGVLRYLMSNNRNRLFQQVQPGETDYGLVYLDRVAQIFQRGGFTPEQAAMGYHLLAQYVMSAAYATVNRQLPGQHSEFISAQIRATSASDFAGVHFFAQPFASIEAENAFAQGLKILLDGFAQWLCTGAETTPQTKARRQAKQSRKTDQPADSPKVAQSQNTAASHQTTASR